MNNMAENLQVEAPVSSPGMRPQVLLAQLRRSGAAIAATAIVGAVLAYAYAGTLPKSYTADAAIAVESDQIAIPELQGALRADATPDLMPLVHTEVQALSARQLVAEVAGKLHLDHDPEFNAALQPPTFASRAKSWFRGFLPVGSPTGQTPFAGQDAVLNAVSRHLVITQDNRSLVIGVAFTAHDPALAANFVNTLIASYIATRAQRRTAANLGANGAMSQRIEQVKSDIDRIEQKMRDLRSASGVVGLRAGTVGQQEVEDLATAAAQATLQRSQIQANWERASAVAAGGSSDALASVLDSETISRLREQESLAAARVADLSQRFGSSYPELRSAEADLAADRRQIADEAHRIVQSLATQLRVARQHELDVQSQLDAARHQGILAQNTQAELDQLQQDASTRRDLYRTLLERAQQTETQPKGTEIPDVRILSKASPPGLPSAPNMKLAAGMGGIGGALLACACVLAFTRSTSAPLDAASFAQDTGLRVIATFRGRAARSGLSARMAESGNGPEADALRMARADLGKLARTAPRVIGFAGAQPGSLTLDTAYAFARIAARDGKRVLLLDADPAGDFTRILHIQEARLADVLRGTIALHDAVTTDNIRGLDILAGASAGAGEALQNGVGLENLLIQAREDYDLVLLAGPQAGVAEAVPVARSSDVTVLVLDQRSARLEAAGAAAARLKSLSRSTPGAILFVPAGRLT
jgi:uncharacterized protein involved in exopolysaccharide biosynthesis